jgi:OOP family OmpA-OmpF porin
MPGRGRIWAVAAAALLGITVTAAIRAQDTGTATDLLTFAQGALPVSIEAPAGAQVLLEHALKLIDGTPSTSGYSRRPLADSDVVSFVYQLPAATTFTAFLVPDVTETPSPSQTFAREIRVFGSASSATGEYQLLATATLSGSATRQRQAALEVLASPPVRWIKVSLNGGIDAQRDQMFLEFSEIVGHGTQESVPLADNFAGTWQGRGVALLLRQDRATVRGCYDRSGKLDGTVSGNILRAVGEDAVTGVKSAWLALVDPAGEMMGVRSTNGAPFQFFQAASGGNAGVIRCAAPEPPRLGCGAVIHGIQFGFDSAVVKAESTTVLDQLSEGLRDDGATSVLIEGHTSSEGSDSYNQNLSERRSAAVAAELVARGLAADRIRSAGVGETRPIASNSDESGRSLNRRVEVHCR